MQNQHPDQIVVCAAHPAAHFGEQTGNLLSEIAGTRVVCVPPPAGADSLAQIVKAIEAERRLRRVGRWVFWGMSGGSFLGQLYARRYPDALAGLILASSGPYFRPTVEDPRCILCPRHPAWLETLASAGLLTGRYENGPTEWLVVDNVGWVFRRSAGAALLVSPDAPSGELQRIMPALWAFDARGWLQSVDIPALVMCGSVDPVVPLSHAEALAAALPRGELVVIDGAGHIPLVDYREPVQDAVRSLLARSIQDRDAK